MNTQSTPITPQLNATVMASAGTGKTYLLISRLVRLLLAGAKPDAILAITFTRKAAAEMQSRLSERLLTLAAAPDETLAECLREMGVTPDAPTMVRARGLFEALLQNRHQVRATTFHAFCQEILRRFPLEADVPPGFELLESGAEQLEAAHDALLTEASNHADGDVAYALNHLLDYCGGLHGLQRALDSFIAHRGDWWAYTEKAQEPVTFATERLQQQLELAPDVDPLEAFFKHNRRQDALAEFAALLAKHPNKGNNNALEAITTARHSELLLAKRFEACREAFLTKQGAPRTRKASQAQAKNMGVEGEERFLALHAELSQAILDTLERLTAADAWRACRAWYIAGNQLLNHYQTIKREQRVLDFNDLEWRTYRLLNHSENALWVQYKLDQRIDHLLVDEFQDTNPTQWRLLLPLLQEMAATQGESQRSVFLVGDAKQSIYRFRRAEPRLFQAAHDWLDSHLDARAFPLHISWRSAPAIMQCVNRIFDEEGPLGGQLRDFYPHDTHHDKLWGEVKLLPLIEAQEREEEKNDKDKGVVLPLRNPLEQPREIATDDRYRREGQQIAEAITDLVESGTAIGDSDNARPIDYGDIMLLVRKRTHISYYEQALRDAQIPYIGADRGTLLQSLEVGDMVALLEVLHTPHNNLSLATVLHSPLFACSDDDLMQLAQTGGGGWYQRLQALSASPDISETLSIAADTLKHWHNLAGHIPIHDLLDRIFNEGNVLERYQAALPAHLASTAVANLTRFLELALEVDSGRYPSLGHFLARLEGMRESRDDAPDEAPVAGGNSRSRVRLLTIHASKGLEAPVVFLADTAQSSGSDKAYRALLDWPPESSRPESFLLVGKQEQQPGLVRDQLEKEQQEQKRESANLLYVALTRARQLLYISGVRPVSGDELGWYGVLRQALDPEEITEKGTACLLTSGTPFECRDTLPSENQAAEVPCDPRLSRPLQLTPETHEIAPSFQEASAQLAGVSGEEDGRIRGIVIHRLLQVLSEEESSRRPKIAQRVAAEFNLEADDREFLLWRDECIRLLQAPDLRDVFACQSGVESLNETPIIYRIKDQTVHGVIDRLLLKQDEIWLIDYKSHRQANAENCAALAESYWQQLHYYAKGVRQLWPGKKIRSFLLFTTPGLLHEVAVNGPIPVTESGNE